MIINKITVEDFEIKNNELKYSRNYKLQIYEIQI